jgi:hypothetical protein
VRLGENDPFVGGAQVVPRDRPGDRSHVAVGVPRGFQRVPHGVHEVGVPLGVKTQPAVLDRRGDQRVTLHVFGDQQLPRLPRAKVGGHPG